MIEFKNIEIKYGDYTAIENLNLKIEDGEFFTFLGPSGCGKTTTLRSLVGFLNPTSGEILVEFLWKKEELVWCFKAMPYFQR